MKIGVIFDLDGTLLDTLDDLTDGVNYALAQFGCPPRDREYIRRVIGNGVRNLIERSLPGKADDPDTDTVLALYKQYYQAHCQVKTKPYAGIAQMLEKLDIPVAIVSNKQDAAVKKLCKDFFPGVYALGEIPGCPRKPAPDMLYKAMEALHMDSCIYVGDSEVDITTSANANVPCISVLWGFRDEEQLIAAGAKHLCDDPAKMPDIIKEIIETYGK